MTTNLRTILFLLVSIITLPLSAQPEAAYYGTNYTVPFAHAYRTLAKNGVNHREAIDRDVYHMARLGFNGFRLHLWDVELSDAEGNLLENDHLELLDYLIAALENRGISIVLTAQTNFGNGYPERNTDPNQAYSYDYEKCRVHDDPAAQAAQEKYLTALASHVNPFTGKSYAADPAIIAMEINNEPCHSGTKEEITAYINRMVCALKKSGWNKDIIYNVSHNLWRTSAFYAADIDGTTYQWYPTGLVHGSERKGNFLPVLDDYAIPFDSVPGYEKQSKYIYEYDPADVLDTYLYPAAARTFRKAGFKWITQFAYDPIDMARFNTEYQTHFLNLAYTPGKAIGMAIAAEATRRIPLGKDYGKYPIDTVFGPEKEFTVSARRNLATLNDGKLYYHTNETSAAPRDLKTLSSIAGVGNSPLVTTDGTGAYFLDKLDADTWRLEVMPDVILTGDPFGKPSHKKTVGEILLTPVTMRIELPGLSSDFAWKGEKEGAATDFTAQFAPGTYLIGKKDSFKRFNSDETFGAGNIRIGEYVLPPVSDNFATALIHSPIGRLAPGTPLEITAQVISSEGIDSVVVYPSHVNFWREDNRLYKMQKSGKYGYSVVIPDHELGNGHSDNFEYNIVVFAGGKTLTFPGQREGTPLDWDFDNDRKRFYSTAIKASDAPIVLFDGTSATHGAELSSDPEVWGSLSMREVREAPIGANALRLSLKPGAPDLSFVSVSKYVGDLMKDYSDISDERVLVLRTARATGIDSVSVGLVTRDGFTYYTVLPVNGSGISKVKTSELQLSPTLLNPAPYPSFLSRVFIPNPQMAMPLSLRDVESIVIYTEHPEAFTLDITGLWLE